jgi:hypothetical protein
MRILTVLIAGLALMTAGCGGKPATTSSAPSGAATQPAASGMAAVDPIDHWAAVVDRQGIKR